jgi:uncharacterized membrane protein (UPF0127 family)
MLCGRVINLRNGEILLPKVAKAETWLERMRGLIGRPPLPEGQGLLIVPCNSIHTFLMRFPIDAVFIDRRGIVSKIAADLPPHRLAFSLQAASVLELMAGQAARLSLAPGNQLLWEEQL